MKKKVISILPSILIFEKKPLVLGFVLSGKMFHSLKVFRKI